MILYPKSSTNFQKVYGDEKKLNIEKRKHNVYNYNNFFQAMYKKI